MSGIEDKQEQAGERVYASNSAGDQGSLGHRLRCRREAMGLSANELAGQLKLKVQIVEAIERDQLDSLGAGVFARGYLTAYAKAVGLPLVAVDTAVSARVTAPALVTHSSSGYGPMLGRYTSRLGHVFLTAAIVVPFIWMATSNQLPSQRATLTSLDVPAPAEGEVSAGLGAPRPAMHAPDVPVMASLTPLFQPQSAAPGPTLPVVTQLKPEPETAAAASIATAEGSLVLELAADSWVEVARADGSVLESSLLRAGTARTFELGGGLRISLGNADGVRLRLNGEPIDVSGYQRANVARFRLGADGALAPAGSNPG
jgi:cytoskeleton protein RodZ